MCKWTIESVVRHNIRHDDTQPNGLHCSNHLNILPFFIFMLSCCMLQCWTSQCSLSLYRMSLSRMFCWISMYWCWMRPCWLLFCWLSLYWILLCWMYYADCHYTECCFIECHYTEFLSWINVELSVFIDICVLSNGSFTRESNFTLVSAFLWKEK